jgi:hypothetical protein
MMAPTGKPYAIKGIKFRNSDAGLQTADFSMAISFHSV